MNQKQQKQVGMQLFVHICTKINHLITLKYVLKTELHVICTSKSVNKCDNTDPMFYMENFDFKLWYVSEFSEKFQHGTPELNTSHKSAPSL